MSQEEPLQPDDESALTQRNDVRIAPVSPGDLPDRFTDENGFTRTWEECKEKYCGIRRGEYANDEFSNTKNGSARRNYGKSLRLDRLTRKEYTDRHTVLLSLRISPTTGERYLDPLTMIEEIKKGYSKALDSLRYEIGRKGGLDYEYFSILTGSRVYGTPHYHIVVFVDGCVEREDFIPICNSFVEGCSLSEERGNLAREGAALVKPESEVEYKIYPSNDGHYDPVGPLTRYAARQLAHFKGVDESSEGKLFFDAAAYATSKNTFSVSESVSPDDSRLNSTPVLLAKNSTVEPDDLIEEPTTIASMHADD